MEREEEKVVALKKAYADIIMNTAKEAAARVMAAERRVVRFEQDLRSTKDEALRMLLRLKKMIDSKTNEAQMISLKQESKIEELEAQLHEAEDIITDLRSELKQAWLELEKANLNQVPPLNEQVTEEQASQVQPMNVEITMEDATISGKVTPDPITDAPSSSGHEETSGLKIIPVIRNLDHIDNGLEQTEQLNVSELDKCYPPVVDLNSIIRRNKETELLKNGCTQRVRAFETNSFDGTILPSGFEDSHKSHQKNELTELTIKASDKEGSSDLPSLRNNGVEVLKHPYSEEETKTTVKAESVDMRSSSVSEQKLPHNSCYPIDSGITQNGKRKRTIQNKDDMSTSFTNTGQPYPGLSCCRTLSYVINGGGKSCEDRPKTTENTGAVMKPFQRLDPGRTLIRRGLYPVSSTSVKVSIKAINKSGSVQNVADKDVESIDVPKSMKQGNDVVDIPAAPSSELNHGTVNVSGMDSTLTDVKGLDQSSRSPSHVDNGSVLKYTFQRKRKNSSSNTGETASFDDNMTKRRKIEEESTAPQPQMTKESSRDSRRLAQVARQLISLSGKSR